MNKSKNLFHSSQDVLYLVCKAGWNLCSKFLPDFAAFRAVYIADYITAAQQAVQEAQSLTPSRKAAGDRSLARTACVNALKAVRADLAKPENLHYQCF